MYYGVPSIIRKGERVYQGCGRGGLETVFSLETREAEEKAGEASKLAKKELNMIKIKGTGSSTRSARQPCSATVQEEIPSNTNFHYSHTNRGVFVVVIFVLPFRFCMQDCFLLPACKVCIVKSTLSTTSCRL